MVDNIVTGDDSPFSITGNVVGILTFVLAVVASVIAFSTLARDSGDEVSEYSKDVQRTLEEIVNVESSLQRPEMQDRRGQRLKILNKEMEERLRKLQFEMGADGASRLGKSVIEEGSWRRSLSWMSALSIRRRLNWVATRQKYLDGMDRITNLKLEVLLEQNTYLLDEAVATKLQLAKLTEAINQRQVID